MNTIELDLTQKEYVFTTQIEDEKLLSKLEEVCEQTPDRMFNATNVKADNAIIYDTHQAKEFIHVDPKHHSVLNRFKDIVEENTLYATHAFNEQHPNHAKRNLAPNHTELQLDTLKVTTLWIAIACAPASFQDEKKLSQPLQEGTFLGFLIHLNFFLPNFLGFLLLLIWVCLAFLFFFYLVVLVRVFSFFCELVCDR